MSHQRLARIGTGIAHTRKRIRRHQCACRILNAVYAVAIAGDGPDTACALQRQRKAQQKFRVAPALAGQPFTDRHRGFTAGKQHGRAFDWQALAAGGEGDTRHHRADIL